MYSDTPKIGTHRSGGDPLSYPDAVVMERPFKVRVCLCLYVGPPERFGAADLHGGFPQLERDSIR